MKEERFPPTDNAPPPLQLTPAHLHRITARLEGCWYLQRLPAEALEEAVTTLGEILDFHLRYPLAARIKK